jgi:hypothetical protein
MRKARVGLAVEWMFVTTAAVFLAHLILEIAFAAWLGYAVLMLLPFVVSIVGGLAVGFAQWLVLRRRVAGSGAWIAFTLLGFTGACTVGVVLAAVAFSAPIGISQLSAFLCFSISTPIVGLAQATVMRRWSRRPVSWVLWTAAGWTAFLAVEIFQPAVFPAVSRVTATLVSAIARYSIGSNAGSTLMGGLVAGAITGVALSVSFATIERDGEGGGGDSDGLGAAD